jgi:serine/threonine protein phosphatase PrpC
MQPSFQISACCESDKGLVRSYNEDACLVNNEDCYYLVADGMGGEAAGELASAFFRDTVVELFSSTPRQHLGPDTLKELVIECFQSAHTRILSHVDQQPSHRGMGCTAELLAFRDGQIVIGHVGDSRTYRLRDSELVQLTTDHSLVQEQADLGLISREQARSHPLKNLVLRVVGGGTSLEVDMIGSDVKAGDIFLLCTDGLTSMVADEQVYEILCYDMETQVKAAMLTDLAKFNGGKDNITVTLIEFRNC